MDATRVYEDVATKKPMNTKECRAAIARAGQQIKLALNAYRACVKPYNEAKEKSDAADRAFAKKNNAKTEARLTEAMQELADNRIKLLSAREAVCNAIAALDDAYSALVECEGSSSPKKAAKAESEKSGAIRSASAEVYGIEQKLSGGLPEPDTRSAEPEEPKAPEEPETAEATEETPAAEETPAEPVKPAENPRQQEPARPDYYAAQPQMYPGAQYIPQAPQVMYVPAQPVQNQQVYRQMQPDVRVSAIDVTDSVQRAVDEAIVKVGAAFEKKFTAFINEYRMPAAPVAPAAQPAYTESDGVARLRDKVTEDEKYVADKLAGLVRTLTELTKSIQETSAALAEISARQKEINDAQKTTNDLQRLTAREQQGIQVQQRMVADEQGKVAEAQTVATETQKAVVEKQKQTAEAQSAMTEQQNAVIDTQRALGDAMKSVIQTQKELINSQQTIIQNSTKTAAAQRELAGMQSEVNAIQREVASANKQVLRESRAMAEKQAAKKQGTAKAVAAAKEEAPAEETSAEGAAQ